MAGAHVESDHIFIGGTRLAECSGPWRVLEFGLGAGTNFARALRASAAQRVELRYQAIEAELIDPGLLPPHDDEADALLRAATSDGTARAERAELVVHSGGFADFRFEPAFDAVFFDPFGPDAQPSSWSVDVFRVAVGALAEHGVLATYSAAGWVRRNLAEAGAFVATLPGPPSKREFTVAARSADALGAVSIRNAPPPGRR